MPSKRRIDDERSCFDRTSRIPSGDARSVGHPSAKTSFRIDFQHRSRKAYGRRHLLEYFRKLSLGEHAGQICRRSSERGRGGKEQGKPARPKAPYTLGKKTVTTSTSAAKKTLQCSGAISAIVNGSPRRNSIAGFNDRRTARRPPRLLQRLPSVCALSPSVGRDPAGGTDIFQMPLGRLKLTAGTDVVRCLRLSSRVYRWYADCCQTPIGNTAGARFPIVGLIHSFMDIEGPFRDETLGVPLCRIFERSATGPLPSNAPAPPSISLLAVRGIRLLGWWSRGLGRPNPFFDSRTKAPLSIPRIVTRSERASRDKGPADV
jgi:hypothetical protein